MTPDTGEAATRSYRFDRILIEGRWRRDAVVEVDSAGAIRSVSEGPGDASATPVVGWAVPGLSNVHSHSFQRGMAGLAEKPGQESFWRWRDVMYAFLTQLNPDDVESVAAQLFVELLKGGFTCVGEFHYLHHGPDGGRYADEAELSRRVVTAARDVGMGLVHIPVVYWSGGFGREPLGPGQRRFALDTAGLLRLTEALAHEVGESLGESVALGWGVHSLRACPPDEWERAVDALSRESDRPIHIHIAEQVKEVEECVAAREARPIEWLMANADVTSRWCLIHGTHGSRPELDQVARAGATVGLCPTTEANLGDGVFPLPEYLESGGIFGIGTDSHVASSAATELRTLEYGQRLSRRERGVTAPLPFLPPDAGTGAALFARAASGGARSLSRPAGEIRTGMRADIVVLDPHHPSLLGRDEATVLDAWIFADHGNPVRDVMMGGRWVVREGLHEEEEGIKARFRATTERLRDRI